MYGKMKTQNHVKIKYFLLMWWGLRVSYSQWSQQTFSRFVAQDSFKTPKYKWTTLFSHSEAAIHGADQRWKKHKYVILWEKSRAKALQNLDSQKQQTLAYYTSGLILLFTVICPVCECPAIFKLKYKCSSNRQKCEIRINPSKSSICCFHHWCVFIRLMTSNASPQVTYGLIYTYIPLEKKQKKSSYSLRWCKSQIPYCSLWKNKLVKMRTEEKTANTTVKGAKRGRNGRGQGDSIHVPGHQWRRIGEVQCGR